MLNSLLLHVYLGLVMVCLLGRQVAALQRAETDEDRAIRQRYHLAKARAECDKAKLETVMPTDGLYCNTTFDNILCWPYTRAGTVAELPCPGFLERFTPDENATRVCLSNGTWEGPPPNVSAPGDGWTNFTACLLPPPTRPPPPYVPAIIKENMPKITLLSKVGYSISLVSLILAIIIMVYFKRLHCHRNTIHINLFVSFTLRAIVCLLIDSLLVKGLGLPQDLVVDEDGDVSFNPEGPHWECKLLMTMLHLALCANYMWIFVEGLYLHTLIFFAIFSQSKVIFKLYIVIGWVTPFIFVISWVVTRIHKNDSLCWNTHEMGYFWIIKVPIVSSIIINFFFFLNIIRVLFTKLRATNSRDPQRYRKLARSTLVLIPLFGVYYIFFIAIGHHGTSDPHLEVVLLYLEMTLSSFQGTAVAFLFCFLNGEVRSEIKKVWNRSQLRRYSTVSMGRSSRAQSTTSFFFKERPSISQGPDGVRRGSTRFPAVDSNVSLRSLGANGAPPSWAIIAEEQHGELDVFAPEAGRVRTSSVSNGGVKVTGEGGNDPVCRPKQNGHVVILSKDKPLDNNEQETVPMLTLTEQNGRHQRTTCT